MSIDGDWLAKTEIRTPDPRHVQSPNRFVNLGKLFRSFRL